MRYNLVFYKINTIPLRPGWKQSVPLEMKLKSHLLIPDFGASGRNVH